MFDSHEEVEDSWTCKFSAKLNNKMRNGHDASQRKHVIGRGSFRKPNNTTRDVIKRRDVNDDDVTCVCGETKESYTVSVSECRGHRRRLMILINSVLLSSQLERNALHFSRRHSWNCASCTWHGQLFRPKYLPAYLCPTYKRRGGGGGEPDQRERQGQAQQIRGEMRTSRTE